MIAPLSLDGAAASLQNGCVIELRQAASAAEIEEVRGLFREYERWVDEPCCFTTFEQELARLPGDYGPPAGRLFLASEAGCKRLVLDTLPKMASAIALYGALGFSPRGPYAANPTPGAIFFELKL